MGVRANPFGGAVMGVGEWEKWKCTEWKMVGERKNGGGWKMDEDGKRIPLLGKEGWLRPSRKCREATD